MDYIIERLSAQNIHHLVPLYWSAFHESISPSFLIKKYDTKAFGAEYIGFIALTQKGTPAAYYGVIPCAFQINGKAVTAAQSADTMTHPDHRKKGLFQLLAKRTYELAREERIEFVFGFPNQDSFPGFVKLGWKFNEFKLQVFTIKAGDFPYARLLRKSPFLFSLYNSVLRGVFGLEHPGESFFETKLQDGIIHDQSFCTYKTYNTSFMISVGKTKAWVKADGRLKVGAVHGLNDQNVSQFINRLKSIASRLGCNEIVFMTSKDSPLYIILSKLSKPKDAFPIGFISLTKEAISLDHVQFEYCDIDIF
jgi:hypothetical protein